MLLSRRQFVKAVGTLGGLFLLSGCEALVDIGTPTLSFEQLRSRCRSTGDSVSISGDHGKVRFSGAIITPTPCHELHAELERNRRTLTIKVTAVPPSPDVACILVLGCLRYRGRIEGLKAGMYTVKITHNGKLISRERVSVQ